MMKYRIVTVVDKVTSIRAWEKDFVLYLKRNQAFSCFDKQTLKVLWSYENCYHGFLYGDKFFLNIAISNTPDVVSFNNGELIKHLSLFFNFHVLNKYCYALQVIKENEEKENVKYNCLKFDIEKQEIVKINESIYPFDLLLDEKNYISTLDNRIFKVDFEANTVDWDYHISDLGPYMDWDYLNPPVWKERKCYNMYYMDGMVFLSVSKGVVALAAETGKQLWWVDFNTTEKTTLRFDVKPNHLSFADGKIYIRDWRQFVSIDMKTGEILMRKKYIDFKVGNEIIRGTLDDGVKIHNGKGYFVLDVQAELYLTSLDLKTGEVSIECELPDIKDQVSAENIHFEGNRLYLRDNASFLYVYEVTE